MSTLSTNNIFDMNGGNTAKINGFAPSASNMIGKNKIINGKMAIAQRGTSAVTVNDSDNRRFAVDRFFGIGMASAGVFTVSQQTDVPSNNEFQNSFRVTVTTADTAITASDRYNVGYIVEGYDTRDLIGRTFTLSFWVRSAKTGIHCIAFRNGGLDRSYVVEYTINAANTWEQKSITVTGGLITAGAWDWTNGAGLRIDWMLAAGSSLQTTPNAWQTGNLLATANQVNCLDTVGNIFAITGVQLEVGEVATPFEHRNYGSEVSLCQRYYWKRSSVQYLTSAAGAGNGFRTYLPNPVTMRAAATYSLSNVTYLNANSGEVINATVDGGLFGATATAGSVAVSVSATVEASAEL